MRQTGRTMWVLAMWLVVGCGSEPSPQLPEGESEQLSREFAPEPPHQHAHAHPEHSHGAISQQDVGVVAPAGGSVAFVEPLDGEIVSGPLVDGKVQVTVVMRAEGVLVEPAGTLGVAHSGHHHVLVDRGALPVGEGIVFDAQHLHLGKGQSVLDVALTPGHHALTLQFADGYHRSFGPALAATIELFVVGEE